MTRVKRGIISRKRHKNLFKLTKGFRGTRNNLVRMAKQATLNAGIFAFTDRRNKKRVFRAQWISTINISLKPMGIKYSEFAHKLSLQDNPLNRKALAEMATNTPETFNSIVKSIMDSK
jgi:large subunit ribosomal protein L20